MNFVYDRENAGAYPLDNTSLVWNYLGFELHREVKYYPDDIVRHWFVINPNNCVAILTGNEYNEITEQEFRDLINEFNQNYAA